MCMEMRGVQKNGAVTRTLVTRGSLEKDAMALQTFLSSLSRSN